MRILFDSSAFTKLYANERGSESVEETCQAATAVALSIICVPEVLSALNRKVREGKLSSQDYAAMKARLCEDVADTDTIDLTPEVIARAAVLLETNALRAMDALHIACALEWEAELFVSSDARQISAARKAGLRTKHIQAG